MKIQYSCPGWSLSLLRTCSGVHSLAGEVPVSVRHCRSWLCLIATMGLVSSLASAQSNLTSAPATEQLLAKAIGFEQDGKWNDALQIWCKIYGQDRQNEEANKHIQ